MKQSAGMVSQAEHPYPPIRYWCCWMMLVAGTLLWLVSITRLISDEPVRLPRNQIPTASQYRHLSNNKEQLP